MHLVCVYVCISCSGTDLGLDAVHAVRSPGRKARGDEAKRDGNTASQAEGGYGELVTLLCELKKVMHFKSVHHFRSTKIYCSNTVSAKK